MAGTERCLVVHWAGRPASSPAIYTFLGAATIPRLVRRYNPLRRIPHVIVQRIARFAHRAPFHAYWGQGSSGGSFATAVEVTDVHYLRMPRPIPAPGMTYVEVRITSAWYGTSCFLEYGGHRFGISLKLMPENDVDTAHLVFNGLEQDAGLFHWTAPQFRGSWEWLFAPVTFGLLVDTSQGCATFRVNDRDGPCVRFPGLAGRWRQHGLHIEVGNFPDPTQGELPRCVVSCEAFESAPPSLLAAAAHPRSAGELVAAGSLLTVNLGSDSDSSSDSD